MANSAYTNQPIPQGKWCITIITFPGPSGSGGDSSGASFGGHAHLAFEWLTSGGTATKHVVFHLVGSRREAVPAAHMVYNVASVERFIVKPAGTRSSGNRSNHTASLGEQNSSTPTNWFGNKTINTSSILVDSSKGIKALGLCRRMTAGVQGERTGNIEDQNFSLIGANIGLGTNCITFCQQVLREIGVEMDWKMYAASFLSSNAAMKLGSLRETPAKLKQS